MSIICTCDWCGDEVENEDRVVLKAERLIRNPRYNESGYIGHYHEECYESVRDAIHAAHGLGQALASVPTAGEGPLDAPLFQEGSHARLHTELEERLSLYPVAYNIKEHGILTVGALIRAVDDGTLHEVRGVGPKTFVTIRRQVQLLKEHLGVDDEQPQPTVGAGGRKSGDDA